MVMDPKIYGHVARNMVHCGWLLLCQPGTIIYKKLYINIG